MNGTSPTNLANSPVCEAIEAHESSTRYNDKLLQYGCICSNSVTFTLLVLTRRSFIFLCIFDARVCSQTEPGPGQYDANDMNLTSQSSAQKSPPFLLSAVRCDKMATKFFTGNFVSSYVVPSECPPLFSKRDVTIML